MSMVFRIDIKLNNVRPVTEDERVRMEKFFAERMELVLMLSPSPFPHCPAEFRLIADTETTES